jgi:hypothetical protein
VQGDVIRLEGCVNDGGFSVPGLYVVTAGIAPLPAGRYRLEYHRGYCDLAGNISGAPRFITSFDIEVKDRAADWPPPPDPVMPVSTYFHQGFGHYFITADEQEQVALDSHTFEGWQLVPSTGSDHVRFGFWRAGQRLRPVCRFFSAAFAPKSSHFYTADPTECEKVKANGDWIYEGIAGYVLPPTGSSGCEQGTPLYRLYNNGEGGAPSHRYTTDAGEAEYLTQAGWIPEGVLGCVPGIAPPYRP